MSKLIALVTLSLVFGACVRNDVEKTEKTSCAQQAEQACDSNDNECTQIIMDDCVPPTCDAPAGQHC